MVEIQNPREENHLRTNENHMLQWGGMPALLPLGEQRRWDWLKSYEMTYLERDLLDLTRINDLKPFRTFQRLAALRCANLLSYSELARDAGVSVETARRYLQYLRISYQIFLLSPFSKNITSTVIKTPKLYWSDIGLWRQLSGMKEGITGQIFENYVISELIKYISTKGMDVRVYFYRTRSGLEIDLLMVTTKGVVGVEIKSRETVAKTDSTALKRVAEALGEEWLGGIVVNRGSRIYRIEEGIWAVPSYRLFT